MRRRTLNFPTTKSSCGTRWGKNGRSGFILAWRMDDGWWGGHQIKSNQNQNQKPKKTQNTTTTKQEKSAPVTQPRTQTTPKPKVMQKQKLKSEANPAAGSKSIQKRDVHMCITGVKNKPNATEKKQTNIMSCNCSYDWKRGKEWGYEFLCQHGEMYSMYDCVWLRMLPLYEGRVPWSH